MCNELIVLKFGGSVLRGAASLRRGADEAYRFWRRGHRVVVVTSALYGTTDRLLASLPADATPYQEAACLARGEADAVERLVEVLDEAGMPAVGLGVERMGLSAKGHARDAEPVGWDTSSIEAAAADHIVVVPGFVARDESERTVLLGRGGSDLTALLLAHELDARCRLIKDVDGLYEWDPATEGPAGRRPRRYRRATYADAFRTDGSILQHKALTFGTRVGLRFEVGTFGASDSGVTELGADKTTLCDRQGDGGAQAVNVALLGFGTVGRAVYTRLTECSSSSVRVTGIGVRDVARAVERGAPSEVVTTDLDAAVTGADVVVELIGGIDVPASIVCACLRRGVPVVTANKALVAERGRQLDEAASAGGAKFRFSAAVGGAMPAVELVERVAAETRSFSVRGILNGATNAVLGLLREGLDDAEAVAEARAKGFTEADPALDLDGFDAAHKLCVLARVGAGIHLDPDEVQKQRFDERRVDAEVCQVARLDVCNGAVVRAEVRYEPANGDLAGVDGPWNAVAVEAGGRGFAIRGRGAGGSPTAQAVMADLSDTVAELGGACRVAPST